MRVRILDRDRQFDVQTRAYAEYLAFSHLVRADRAVRQVTVTLSRQAGGPGRRSRVRCSIVVWTATGERRQVEAVNHRAYAAIDTAVSMLQPAGVGRPPT